MRYACFTLALIVSVILFSGESLQGQDPDDALKRGPSVIPEAYDRSSLSWVLVYSRGDSQLSRIRKHFSDIDHSDKFFLNPLENEVLEMRRGRTRGSNMISVEDIQNNLEELNVSRQIISHWYSRTDDGLMDMERIHQRGLENATDADVMRQQSTTRGNWALMDYGNRLIDKSYIVVLDFYSVDRVNTDNYEGYRAQIAASLFRVNLSEEDKERIYDAWVLEEDPEEEKQKKRELFETINPPLKYVTTINTTASSYNYKEHTVLGRITPTKSTDELFADLVQSGYDDVLFELEREYDDFNVITPLYSTRPLGAKIGKREGLKVDQRFFVYEHRYDPATQTIKEVRRGVIRATSDITDNRGVASGETKPSKFYQVAGRRLHEGYVIQQSNDYGIGIHFGYDFGGEIGGGSVGLDYAIGRSVGIRAFYVTANLGINSKKYPEFSPDDPGDQEYLFDGNVAFLRWDIGLSKGMHFLRNFELRPYLTYGQEQASNDVLDEDITAHFLKAGANLALNITYNFQIVAGYNFYAMIGNAYQDEDALDYKYNEIFDSREGGAQFVGLRFKF